ncbi:MAG: 3'(2'),5'-bisphosphate nucleotidase [Phycisphaerales bacterium]|nr:3'(2'),5'-bisphosphate nucleotidase [Phycisphaerales bacterium]
MIDPSTRTHAARVAVARACVVTRSIRSAFDDVPKVIKPDGSPVTVADYASQVVVALTLAELLPRGHDIRLVGEEDASHLRTLLRDGERAALDIVAREAARFFSGLSDEQVLDALQAGAAETPAHGPQSYWTLDPIDGTKGFIRGGQYCVALAYIERGTPVLGVLGCPNLSRDLARPFDDPDPVGSVYLAAAEGGLFEYRADDDRGPGLHIRRLEPAEGEPVRLVESVDVSHSSHDASERVLEKLGEPAEPSRLDGQAKYAVLARGQADLYLKIPRTRRNPQYIWDHAAGSIVATEAGCFVTDLQGAALDFSHGRQLRGNVGVIAGGARVHGLALRAVGELGLVPPREER